LISSTGAEKGYLVDADALPGSNESQSTVPAADRVTEALGKEPKAGHRTKGQIAGSSCLPLRLGVESMG
jgi:hypothetical protein